MIFNYDRSKNSIEIKENFIAIYRYEKDLITFIFGDINFKNINN